MAEKPQDQKPTPEEVTAGGKSLFQRMLEAALNVGRGRGGGKPEQKSAIPPKKDLDHLSGLPPK